VYHRQSGSFALAAPTRNNLTISDSDGAPAPVPSPCPSSTLSGVRDVPMGWNIFPPPPSISSPIVALQYRMAQPRKYSTDADRYRAYRERKKERVEALAREVKTLTASTKDGRLHTKRGATPSTAAEFRKALGELRKEMAKRRRRAKNYLVPVLDLLDYIDQELDRLMQ
jgi:hypothetical protein